MSENSFRASVFLCASATGVKLCPLIVFSGTPGGPIEEELHAHPLYSKEVFLAVQKKGYCDERVMHIWINEVRWRQFLFSLPKLLICVCGGVVGVATVGDVVKGASIR